MSQPGLSGGAPPAATATPTPVAPPIRPGVLQQVGATIGPGHLTVEVRGAGFQRGELVCLRGDLGG